MNTDAKDVTRRFYEEIINQKNIHAIDRFCTTDFVDHNPPPGGEGSLDATKQQFLELVAAFPDLKMMVQDQIAEGDKSSIVCSCAALTRASTWACRGAGSWSRSAASISSAWSTTRLSSGGGTLMT
jgi:predicted SnoaL-like aldol condensation-catalyzing enzyme